MIVFDLECRDLGHRFEGWFGSSEDFASQQARGLLACPQCGTGAVQKAPMAPHVGRKGNQVRVVASAPGAAAEHPVPAAPASTVPVPSAPRLPPDAMQFIKAMAAAQAKALESSRWVGNRFAEESRAIHYGEREGEVIHGQATAEQASELLEEGILVAPLLVPVVPPDELN